MWIGLEHTVFIPLNFKYKLYLQSLITIEFKKYIDGSLRFSSILWLSITIWTNQQGYSDIGYRVVMYANPLLIV